MNPLNPNLMSSGERRAELVRILARGLVRLRARQTGAQSSELSDGSGESCLHYPPDECRHAAPTHRRTA